MSRLFEILFNPPPLPPLNLPLSARTVPTVRATVLQAFEVA